MSGDVIADGNANETVRRAGDRGLGVVELDEDGSILGANEHAVELLDGGARRIDQTTIFELAELPERALEPGDCFEHARGDGPPLLFALERIEPGRRLVCVIRRSPHDRARASAEDDVRDQMRTLISGFAHEVRNPLAGILSITESLIQSSKSTEAVREMLSPVPELIDRIETVISESVSYSRPEEPTPSRIDLEGVLTKILVHCPAPKDVEVRVEVDARAPMVFADPWQVRKLLRTLLENAYQSGASQVDVRLRAYPCQGRRLGVRVSVHDDGEGVSPDIREDIFRPFFTTRARHTGLGLAAARDLARLNGGDLWLDEDEDHTCFRAALPIDSEVERLEEAHDDG